jgi:hypothetical protein
MSRTSQALKRLGVAGVALATIGAGVPAFFATAAQAAPGGATTQLVISPLNQSGAAGTCLLYTVTPLNGSNEQPGDTPTITVQVTENPVSDTQDVDFCSVAGTTTTRGTTTTTTTPTYTNGTSVPTLQTYNPSTTNVSPAPATGTPGNNPDSASGASGQSTATNTNPSGTDTAAFKSTNSGAAPTATDPNNGSIVFGIVGAIPGGANITAFIDTNTDLQRQATEIRANTDATATFTAGNSPEAVTVVDAEPETGSAPINSLITFTVTLKNASGQTVSGVTPTAVITSGPDAAQAGATDGTQFAVAVTCGSTVNNGTTTCSYTTRNKTGTDTINVYVNKSCGLSSAFDASCEPNDEITRTVAPSTSAARNLVLSPRDTTTFSGSTREFQALVKDVAGTPVPDVAVQFCENGAGRISGGDPFFGQTCVTVGSGADGIARATVTSAPSETGTQEITATIVGIGTRNSSGTFTPNSGTTSGDTQCGQAAGAGTGATSTTPKGNCSDNTTNTFVVGTPSPTATGGRSTLTLTVTTPSIPAGSTGHLVATGAANEQYQLMCYTRPSTTFVQARAGAFNAAGDPVPFDLSLGRNTRCFIQYTTNPTQGASPSVVINVRTVLSLSTVRQGVRTYLFQGRNLPRVGGQRITLYRVDGAGNEIRAAFLITDSSGIYRLTRTFTGTGTFQFKVRTPQTLNNAAGVSNTITVRIF